MAADKEIMKAIETLRLDRPGRTYAVLASVQRIDPPTPGDLAPALSELAATYREEAELWAKSGAKGWKGSEAEKHLVAQHIDDVAAQLDNAGGGAALSVSDPALDAEIDAAAQRVAAVTDLSGLDRLIADSVAQRKGHVRDEFLPDRHPTVEPMSLDDTRADTVTAYLKGEIGDIPGSPPLAPGSVIGAPELDNPFAKPCCENMLDLDEDPAPWCDGREGFDHGEHNGPCKYKAHLRADHPTTLPINVVVDHDGDVITTVTTPEIAIPKTWESGTMTADGHRRPGLAPLLGQPGNASAGYSHAYIPPGGRQVAYAELLRPIPAASLPAHLSHSQGNTIGDCGVKYRLQRVEGLPQVPQWANVGGTAFHAAVEAIERTMVKVGRVWIDVELGWKEHFEEQIRIVSATSPVPVSVWRAARKGAEGRQWWEVNGPLMLRRYLDARPAEPTSNLPANPDAINGAVDPFQLAIELDLTVDVPTPYGPLPFNAKLDRVTNGPIPPDSPWVTLVIRDYKTSYERPTDTTQLGDYANVLRLWGVPESVKIFGTYFDARRGEWTTPVDLLDAHPFEAFQYRVTTAHAQKRALTTGPTPARPSSYCGGCSVRYACPVMANRS